MSLPTHCPKCGAPVGAIGTDERFHWNCRRCGSSGGAVFGPPEVHREPQSDAMQAAAAALDLLGTREAMVIVRCNDDPYGVEMGANVRPALAIALLEMALLKARKAFV